jgi:hypothetical protein
MVKIGIFISPIWRAKLMKIFWAGAMSLFQSINIPGSPGSQQGYYLTEKISS